MIQKFAKSEARIRRINRMKAFVLQHSWLNAVLSKISMFLFSICDTSDFNLEKVRSISSEAAVVLKASTGEYGVRLTNVHPKSTFENRTRYVIVVNPNYYQTPRLVADDKGFEEVRRMSIPADLERAILRSADSSHSLNGWEGYMRSMLHFVKRDAA